MHLIESRKVQIYVMNCSLSPIYKWQKYRGKKNLTFLSDLCARWETELLFPGLNMATIMDRGYTANPLNSLGCVITEIKQADQYCDHLVCGDDSGLLTLPSRMRKDNVRGPLFFFSIHIETAKLYRRRKTSWRSNSFVESFSSRGRLCCYWVF